ncbi:DUF3168 domain-containing protein [uncultured Roseovarius sp.]|uniref:DUF3168 domain-containing protein n=1 Tax=uncultured Roseovarius sp. TaxID=293344 RepID=UPI000C563B0C|nr:hypothetical protein [Roseovarius sp.]MBD11572.1 hypothetical protein [Roseovarius sp.]|tara:strand:- start:81 stop:467 length:387 start_codon:yes stop_codon:yes gene_type:complete
MEEAFKSLLTGSAAVTAIVPASRINWGAHPQGAALPGLVLNVIDDAEGLTTKGRDGLSQGRLQVDCYAETYKGAKQLSRVVRSLLHGYRGGSFRLVSHDSTRDSREGGSNEATRPYRVSMDFNTHWRA